MPSLPGGPPAVNAGGADPAPPPPATTALPVPPAPLPTPPAAPPFPPCPECGGEVMRYLARDLGEDELLCPDCWWSAPTPAAATAPGRAGG